MKRGEDWTRLRTALSDRIDELGLQQSEIQAAGGPSPAKVREILNGRSQTLVTSLRRGLERALQWPTGTIDTLLAGDDPTPPAVSLSARDHEIIEAISELAAELQRRHPPGKKGPRINPDAPTV